MNTRYATVHPASRGDGAALLRREFQAWLAATPLAILLAALSTARR